MEPKSTEKEELIKEVVGFDFRKVWTTFKELTVRPGETVAAYCDGARKKYISPVTYFLVAYGINFFVAKLSGMLNYSLNTDHSAPGKTSPGGMIDSIIYGAKMGNPNITNEEIENITTLLAPSFEFVSSKEGILILTFPVIMILQWLFFRSFRKPFLQHLYFLLYVSAQINLLTIPLMIPFFFTQSLLWFTTVTTLAVSVGIYFYAELKFYPRITFGDIIIRTIGQVAAGAIPFFIWFCAVLAVTIVIVKNFFS